MDPQDYELFYELVKLLMLAGKSREQAYELAADIMADTVLKPE